MSRPGAKSGGDRSGPERLGDVLGQLFVARGWGRRLERLQLETAWAEAAGPAIAGATRLGNLRRGVMEVIVGNAALLQELAHFQKRTLLEAFRSRTNNKVLDLRFRLGVVTDEMDSTDNTDGPKRK
jgi:hypothetical protein